MGSVYPKKGRLYLGYKDENGKQRYKSSGLKIGEEKRAKAMLKKIEAQVSAAKKLGVSLGDATVQVYFEQWIASRATQGLASTKDDKARIKLHVLPEIGHMAIADVRPRHIRDLVRTLRRKKSARGEPFAPRSVRHFYAITRRMFLDAVVDELIGVSPCVLKRHDLPKKVDKDPTFRARATFTTEELVSVITDRRIPEDRRMFYALMGIGAMRFGEAAARRWRDYNPALKPLGKLVIASSFCVKTHKEKSVKTQAPREMPVHQALAQLLEAWKLRGYERYMGTAPNPDDLIVPSSTGRFRNVNRGLHNLHYDLGRIGQRTRRQHDLRRTFITLARSGGARPDVLKWATHGPSGDIIDIYTSMPWEPLCEAVTCLKLVLPEDQETPLNIENDIVADEGLLPSYYHSDQTQKNPEVSTTSGLLSCGADGTRRCGAPR